MLLTNRRTALIHLCLIGMQTAWLLPFWLLLYEHASSPWAGFGLLFGALLSWTLILELLNRASVQSPQYDLITLALMVVTTLLAVRLMLYGDRTPFDISWLGQLIADTLNHTSGLPPGLVVIGFNLVLWQRATRATSRNLAFFEIGVSFRVGLLLLILGGGLYAAMRDLDLLPLIWFYLVVGLIAIALARISEKAVDAQSAGKVLPARRLVQVLTAIGVTVALAYLLAMAYTAEGIRRFLHLFDPVWHLMRPGLLAILLWLARLLNPVLLWLEGRLIELMEGRSIFSSTPGTPATGGQPQPPPILPSWPLDLLKLFLVIALIVGSVIGLIVFLLLYLERVRRGAGQAEMEQENNEPVTLGGGIVSRSVDSLRRAAQLVRRLGMSRHLLAAISVQNLYANLCRLARRRGFGRLPAQPPDDYLPILGRAFPGQQARLARLTDAYMRVHYGDQPVGFGELAGLREDYRVVRESHSESQRVDEPAERPNGRSRS